MDLICLWIGRIIVVPFGIAGMAWIIHIPFELAWSKMKADVLFLQAFNDRIRRKRI